MTRIQTSDAETVEIEAAAFRRLLDHLMVERPDVQNIDLMILAGFCRNCLADWYRDAAEERGIELSRDEARYTAYWTVRRYVGKGVPPLEVASTADVIRLEFKARHQAEATPEQLAAFEARKR